MAIREILTIGDPILRTRARPLERDEITSKATATLVADMVETMHAADGIGIAAPQIGESIRLAVIEIDEEEPRYPGMEAFGATVFVNPKVTVLDEGEQSYWEGCLSVPDLRGLVPRPAKVRVDFCDLSGQPRVLEADDFLATVVQHELDHLDGVLFVDKVRDPTKLATIENYRRFYLD